MPENLLKRDFKADKPNQKWVTDVTQYRVGERWLYLSAVKDLFDNEIVAYELSERNDNSWFCRRLPKRLLSKRRDRIGHSQCPSPPVHVSRLPRYAAKGWRQNQHVSPRQLPRQRLHRELLLASKNGRALSL